MQYHTIDHSLVSLPMRRFFLSEQHAPGDVAVITGYEYRHIVKVLRLCENDTLHLFDADGNRYTGVISDTSRKSLSVLITSVHPPETSDDIEITICQAVIKSHKMDYVFQKCCELGVKRILPFVSSRTVPRWNNEQAHAKHEHWKKIILASIKQSGTQPLPSLNTVCLYQQCISEDFETSCKYIFWEGPDTVPLRKKLERGKKPLHIVFAVGPEGGFSRSEISLAEKKGFTAVGLGKSILRSETVAPAVTAIIRYHYDIL